jgi:hypothetical protein
MEPTSPQRRLLAEGEFDSPSLIQYKWLFEGRRKQQRFFHRTWSHVLGPDPDYPKSFTSKRLLSSGLLGDGADLDRVFLQTHLLKQRVMEAI